MRRKILINLIVAFIFFPIIMIAIKYGDNIVKGDYQYQDELYPNLKEYILGLLYRLVYPIISVFFLLFVLIPFQIIKDYIRNKNRVISIFGKALIFFGIVLCFFIIVGSFTNIWLSPWWENYVYLLAATVLSVVFTPILYFMIDKYVEGKPN